MKTVSENKDLFPGQIARETDQVISQYPVWDALKGKSLFLTGGTGFFGKWLLFTLARANEVLDLNLSVHILSRNPAKFMHQYPLFASQKNCFFFEGDIRDFSLPKGESYDFCIHGAASASAKLNSESPLQMFDEVFLGTRNCIQRAIAANVKRFLFISSGAVYGKQPENLYQVEETFLGGPNPLVAGSAYAEAKRAAEFWVNQAGRNSGMECIIGRAFAFVGPFLPLETHFAIGNFILSAIKKQPITILGDGTPLRSYLYASDLTGWLLSLLTSGKAQEAYNIGSEKETSIKDLAHLVARVTKHHMGYEIPVKILGTPQPGKPREVYCPSTHKIERELKLPKPIALEDAIKKTLDWYREIPFDHS
jgi:nucleoside-diphosphate-sugar epimerase